MSAQAPAEMPQHSLIKTMAGKYGLEANTFKSTVIKTLFPSDKQNPSNEQVAAFLVVANQYNLNPFIKEIYAFPGKGGGIIPIVSIDGWNTIINREKQYDGVEFTDQLDEGGKLFSITAKIYRKDRSHPIMVTEYMKECSRNTDPWKQYPARMLRHKALIQAARYAFGLSGIFDPDEAERIAQGSNGDDLSPVPVAVITEVQRTSLVDHAQKQGVIERLGEIVNAAGFEMLAHITVDKFTEVVFAITAAGKEVAEPVAATPEPENPAADIAAEADSNIIDADESEDESEADTSVDADESQLADLRAAVNEQLNEKVGSLKGDQKLFLKGRVVDNESAEVLTEMLETLRTM